MSETRFIADLHLGHKNIAKFEGKNRGGVTTVEEHDEWIIERWNQIVCKQDTTWVLGDVAFTKDGLHKLKRMNGTKNLILGNHDNFSINKYSLYFNKIHGFMKKNDYWLSHAPIRDCSLRGHKNIHGHIHSALAPSDMHICVSVEHLSGQPATIEKLEAMAKFRIELRDHLQILFDRHAISQQDEKAISEAVRKFMINYPDPIVRASVGE